MSRLNVKPSEILFIDDLGINLKPARDIGFVTYKMVEDEKCVEYIKTLRHAIIIEQFYIDQTKSYKFHQMTHFLMFTFSGPLKWDIL